MHVRIGVISRAFLFFVLIILFIPIPPKGLANPEAERVHSITSGGLERSYRIHTPPSYDKMNPLPLLIGLHGGGGTGKKMEKLTLEGLTRLAEELFTAVARHTGGTPPHDDRTLLMVRRR